MKYRDLRDFVHGLEQRQLLRRIDEPVSTRLEMTALADRVLRAGGPALLLSNPTDGDRRYKSPVLLNLWRSAWAPTRSARCARSASCWRR
jgi:4-hydroxy-3-polyprenylbenzoate decarboxylase